MKRSLTTLSLLAALVLAAPAAPAPVTSSSDDFTSAANNLRSVLRDPSHTPADTRSAATAFARELQKGQILFQRAQLDIRDAEATKK